jgi:hypothetical protein
VLLQAHHLLGHDVAATLLFLHDINSAIYSLAYTYLPTKEDYGNNYCIRLYNLKSWGYFGVQMARWVVGARWAVTHGSSRSGVRCIHSLVPYLLLCTIRTCYTPTISHDITHVLSTTRFA